MLIYGLRMERAVVSAHICRWTKEKKLSDNILLTLLKMTQHLSRVETFIAAKTCRCIEEGERLLSPVLCAGCSEGTAGQLGLFPGTLRSAGAWLLCHPVAGRTEKRTFGCHCWEQFGCPFPHRVSSNYGRYSSESCREGPWEAPQSGQPAQLTSAHLRRKK